MTDKRPLQCLSLPLEELFQGETDTLRTADLLSHLEVCPTCRERLQVMLGLQILLQPSLRKEWMGFSRSFQLKAASVLLLASLASALLLYMPHFGGGSIDWWERPPQPPFQLQTRDTPHPVLPAEAFEAYRQGRYAEAASLLSRYPEDPAANLFRGISLFLLGRSEEALRLFSRLGAESGEFRSQALWYEARIRLQQGEFEEARKVLEEIATDSRYREPARQLLQRLERELPR